MDIKNLRIPKETKFKIKTINFNHCMNLDGSDLDDEKGDYESIVESLSDSRLPDSVYTVNFLSKDGKAQYGLYPRKK